MKKKTKRRLANIADKFLLFVAPAGFAMYSFFEPSTETSIISVGGAITAFGVLFTIFLFLLIKKKKLDPHFKDIRHILNNHRSDYAIEKQKGTLASDVTMMALSKEIKKRQRQVLIYERTSILTVLVACYLIVSYISTNIQDLKTVIGISIACIAAGSLMGFSFGTDVSEEIKIPGDKETK